jgi:hypothetical protein
MTTVDSTATYQSDNEAEYLRLVAALEAGAGADGKYRITSRDPTTRTVVVAYDRFSGEL